MYGTLIVIMLSMHKQGRWRLDPMRIMFPNRTSCDYSDHVLLDCLRWIHADLLMNPEFDFRGMGPKYSIRKRLKLFAPFFHITSIVIMLSMHKQGRRRLDPMRIIPNRISCDYSDHVLLDCLRWIHADLLMNPNLVLGGWVQNIALEND